MVEIRIYAVTGPPGTPTPAGATSATCAPSRDPGPPRFGPGTGRRLLVTQVALAAVIGLRIALGPYLDLAGQPPALFRPVWFLRLLDGMPGHGGDPRHPGGGHRRRRPGRGRLAPPGRLRRGLGVPAGAGRTPQQPGQVPAQRRPPPAGGGAVPRSRRRPDGGTRPASVRFGWPVHTATVVVAGAYFFSGLAKLLHSGPAWITTDNMRYVLYEAAGGGKVRFPGVPTWLAEQAGLAHGLAAGVLLFELTFPVVLIGGPADVGSPTPPARPPSMRGRGWSSGLDYWAWAAVAAVVLVDCSPIVGRHLGTRMARYRLWPPPRFSATDGNRRPVGRRRTCGVAGESGGPDVRERWPRRRLGPPRSPPSPPPSSSPSRPAAGPACGGHVARGEGRLRRVLRPRTLRWRCGCG